MQSDGDELELLAREHLAGRVVRRVDDDRAGARPERRAQLVRVDRPVGLVQRDVARHGAGQDRVGAVVLVVRLEDDDLVARVEQPQHRRDHRLGRAAGHGDLRLGVDRAPGREVAGVDVAIASRSGFAPQVIAYWLMSSWTALAAASFSSGGQAKSGNPWARLTAPCWTASRFISRMTDSVKLAALAEIRGRLMARSLRRDSDELARDALLP